MHPAYSVIFFTVSSGIGYGLLGLIGALAALGLLPADPLFGAVGLGLGFVAVTAGLLSSTFHLGHPERAWRAFTQWRSSWLSREGIAAVVTFAPLVLLAYCWIIQAGALGTLRIWAVLTALGALVTVYCTGMIYRSLKTVHQWHNAWTLPNYLLMGLAGGAVWLAAVLAVLGHDAGLAGVIGLIALAAAWAGKAGYWRFIATTHHPSTPESATGLGRVGTVKRFESPHTSANYLLKEMGFQIARKHADKLRRQTHILAFAIPIALIATSLTLAANSAALQITATILAAIAITAGTTIERWLFFAQAKHVVTLYYGRDKA